MALSDFRPAFGDVQNGRLTHFNILAKPVKPTPEPYLKEEDRQRIRDLMSHAKMRRSAQLMMAGTDIRTRVSIACDLSLGLECGVFRIDTAALLNEYQRQSAPVIYRLLADAETRRDILFFDEAEGLFPSVEASENTETGATHPDVLLKITDYQGLVLLATRPRLADHPMTKQLSGVIRF